MILTNLTDNVYKGCILVLLLAWTVPSLAQETALTDLTGKFESGTVFHANFSHKYVDSYTGDTVSNKGVIWVGENKYKVRTEDQSVVVDGKTSMVFDDHRNRVIISKYEPEEDDFAPSRILNGADSTYTVTNERRNAGKITISLESEDPFSVFKQVEITLTKNIIPLRIFALDQADNEITTTFTKGRFIAPTENMFHLDYPEGAEIVDMRN